MDTEPISRRDFLASVGLAAAAGAIGGAAVSQEPPARKVRIGVVGGGFGAGFHWHEDPGCEVAAVSDLLPDRRQNLVNRYGCQKTYDSLEELI